MKYSNNAEMPKQIHTPVKHSSQKVVISIAFTSLVLVVSLLPFLYDVLISVKDYAVFKGLGNSPYVGLANYQKFFNSPYFTRLLSNTIVQSLLFSIFLFLLSVILGYIVVSLPSKSIISNVIVTFALIPVFIPDVVYIGWFMNLPLSGSKPFVISNIAVWFIPFIRAIKYAGIPVLITSIISGSDGKRNTEKMHFLLPLQVAACFVLFSLMFVTINDITITSLASNPLIYEVIDSFNMYIYRSGLLNAKYSDAAAVTVISRFLCLISAAVFFIPFTILARNLFGKNLFSETLSNTSSNEEKTDDENIADIGYKNHLISTIIAVVLIFIMAAFPYTVKNVKIFDLEAISLIFQNPNTMNTFPLYIFISLVAAFINVGLSAVLAYPLVCGSRISKRISMVLLLLIAILASTPISIGSYMLLRGLGIFNTVYAVMFALIFPITGVWAFAAIANSQGVSESGQYAKAIGKPAIALVMVQMVYCFNNFMPSLIYIADRRLFSPVLVYRELALMGGEAARQLPQYSAMVFWYGIILSIIPVGILTVLRALPKKTTLLSILGMAHRK